MRPESFYDRLPDPDRAPGAYRAVSSRRLFAWFVDLFVILAATAVVVVATAFLALFLLPALVVGINFLYRWVTLTRGSATWGMRLAGIEMRRHDGAPFDSLTAFLHTLGYSLSMAMVLPQVLSIGLMLTNRRGQGLSDIALGTVALNRAPR